MPGPHRSPSGGFTLVELIVASTLMILVLSGVYLTFSTAVRAWRSAEDNYETFEDARRALGLLDREVRAIPPDALHLMRGGEDTLEFVTLAQPMDVETAATERLIHVVYRVVSDRDGVSLVREEALVEGALPDMPDPETNQLPTSLKTGPSRGFVIARNVSNFTLYYEWPAPAEDLPPEDPPFPVPLIGDATVEWATPALLYATLSVADSGNIANDGVSEFSLTITRRGETSATPRVILEREGYIK